jgi:hypothetical protein
MMREAARPQRGRRVQREARGENGAIDFGVLGTFGERPSTSTGEPRADQRLRPDGSRAFTKTGQDPDFGHGVALGCKTINLLYGTHRRINSAVVFLAVRPCRGNRVWFDFEWRPAWCSPCGPFACTRSENSKPRKKKLPPCTTSLGISFRIPPNYYQGIQIYWGCFGAVCAAYIIYPASAPCDQFDSSSRGSPASRAISIRFTAAIRRRRNAG